MLCVQYYCSSSTSLLNISPGVQREKQLHCCHTDKRLPQQQHPFARKHEAVTRHIRLQKAWVVIQQMYVFCIML